MAKRKPSSIARAIAGLCATGTACSALALPASSYTNVSEFVGDTVNFRISGSDAYLQAAIITEAAQQVCVAGSLHRYRITGQSVLFCTSNGVMTLPAGVTKVAIYFNSVNGNSGGIAPIQSAANLLPFLDLSKIAASCPGAGTDVVCTAASTTLTTPVSSHIGLTDIEPSFFGGRSTYSNIDSQPFHTVIVGLPVTRTAFMALQAVQFPPASGCAADDLRFTCMPSLPLQIVSKLYTEVGMDWTQPPLSLPPAAFPGGDSTVYVARRVDTSATQKIFEAKVGLSINSTATGKSCNPAGSSFVAGPVAATNAAASALCVGGNLVVNSAGSSQVVTCMDSYEAQGLGAIGVLATDRLVTAAGSIRFVRISGLEPTWLQVASGNTGAFVNTSLNTRVSPAPPATLTLAQRGYAAFIPRLNQAQWSLVPAAGGVVQPFSVAPNPVPASGLSGLMAMELGLPDYTGVSGRNPWDRRDPSGQLNNCRP